MSKPPSKSGGPGRGRNSGGSSRDGSSFGGSSSGGDRGRSPRGGGGSDGGSRYNGGSRGDGPRGGGGSQDGGSRYNGGARGDGPRGGPRGDSPRGGQRSGERSGGERGSYRSGGRDEAPRGGYAPRDGGGRSGSREDAPRGAPRGTYSRDGAARGAPRDGGPRAASRESTPREDAPRSGPRDYSPRGAYSRGDTPRGEGRGEGRGESRDGAPRATYSRGAPREDRYGGGGSRYGDKSENRYGGGRENRYGGGRGEAPRGPRPIARPGPAPRAAAPTPKNPLLPARDGERIAKLLARAGVASRREVERMIIEGRVRLGDALIETPSTVLTSLAGVTVDGNPVAAPEGTRLFLFHKPAGLITAERDPAGRPTIYSALRNALPDGAGRVMPIGRLDLSTEGLLLLTNDGEFKRQLELPATGVPRTYRARTFGDITQSRLEELMEGIEVDGVIYGKINANMERRTGRNQWIEMTLTEGKNREVRRVLEALDLQVSRLLRVSYGPFRLGDLPKGAAGEVSQKDLETFRRSLKESEAREANARAIDARKAGIDPDGEASGAEEAED